MAVADRGYYNAPQIKACHDAGIAAILRKPMTSNAKAEGRFDQAGCPQGLLTPSSLARELAGATSAEGSRR